MLEFSSNEYSYQYQKDFRKYLKNNNKKYVKKIYFLVRQMWWSLKCYNMCNITGNLKWWLVVTTHNTHKKIG